MITSLQFEDALNIIHQYVDQQEHKSDMKCTSGFCLNLQNKITPSIFFALQRYFKEEENVELDWNSLKAVPLEILQNLNYSKLRGYRGFGIKSEIILKELIATSI